jgi:hypothetical protein
MAHTPFVLYIPGLQIQEVSLGLVLFSGQSHWPLVTLTLISVSEVHVQFVITDDFTVEIEFGGQDWIVY